MYKNIVFDVDWQFIVKNIILTLILTGVLWRVKSDLFVFDDMLRYKNL